MEQVLVRESLALLLRIIEGIRSDISSHPTISRYLRDVRRFLEFGTAIAAADLIAVGNVVDMYYTNNTGTSEYMYEASGDEEAITRDSTDSEEGEG